jgi:hypothetical protein
MEQYTWVTSLLRLPIRVYFQHYVELIILIVILIFYRSLKSNRLGIVLPLWVVGFMLDLICKNFSFYLDISILQILPFLISILGIYIYPSLKKLKVGIIVLIIIIDLTLDIVSWNYANRGMHNLFLLNLFYVVISPLFFRLFYNMLQLQLKEKYKRVFISIAILSIIFFLYDYFNGNELRLNYRTIISFHLQSLMLCCFIIARLVIKENSSGRLTNEPYFWICTGQILFSLIVIVFEGLHPYLVSNHIEIYYKYKWLIYVLPAANLMLDFCYVYAFMLCGKQHQDRLSFSFHLQRGIQ